MSRATLVAALAFLALVALLAAPAHAHPEEGITATNYRAEITSIQPDPGGLSLRVAGGDSWLEMRVDPDIEVYVLGYEEQLDGGEPYIRIDRDGSVHVNGNSPAAWMNEERYGDVDIPEWVDPGAPPRWQILASAGTYYAEWHDHRTHWMSPQLPPSVRDDPGSVHHIFDWEVPLVVDGEDVAIRGTLRYLPNTAPLLPLIVGLLAAAGAFLVGRQGRDAGGAIAALLAGGAATVVTVGAIAHPDAAAGESDLLLPLVAVVAAAAALVPRLSLSGGGVLLAAVGVVAWAIPQVPSTVRPIVFSTLPRPAVVVLIPLALGLAVGAAAAAFTGLPEPTPEGEQAPDRDVITGPEPEREAGSPR